MNKEEQIKLFGEKEYKRLQTLKISVEEGWNGHPYHFPSDTEFLLSIIDMLLKQTKGEKE